MADPVISVVIPVYNCAAYLARTLDSVLQQQYRPFEVIVVDDGSADHPEHIVEHYQQQCPDLIRLLSKSNGGVSSARNTGILAARGDWIAFLDGDDIWLPQKLALQVKAIQDFPQAMLIYTEFAFWRPSATGDYPDTAQYIKDYTSTFYRPEHSGWMYHQQLLTNWVLTSTALVRYSALQKSGLFDEELPVAEDWDLFLRLSRLGLFCKIGYVLTLYRQSATSLTTAVKSRDYASAVLDAAISRYGYTSPDGTVADMAQFRQRSFKRHFSYGYTAFKSGHYQSAAKAFPRALSYRPWHLKSWLFRLRCVLKS
ncbi:glycosyltransferase [Chromatiaceae bacterium AAb-1]|nr:glycosyltransferase [Chromatiaceae bacterium AAb-1]